MPLPYWRDSDTEGDDHWVKIVVASEGLRRYDYTDGDSTFDDDFLSATDAALMAYSSHYFEYDSEGPVVLATFGGDCGCSGGTVGEYEFEYDENSEYTDNTGYDTTWKDRVMVDRPDGTFVPLTESLTTLQM